MRKGENQEESAKLNGQLSIQYPDVATKVDERVKVVFGLMAKLVLGETARWSQLVRICILRTNRPTNVGEYLRTFAAPMMERLSSRKRFNRTWQKEVSTNIAAMESLGCDAKQLEEFITGRLEQGPPAYRGKLQTGLEQFLRKHSDVICTNGRVVIDTMGKSLDKYASGPKRLASVELTSMALKFFKEWCCDIDLSKPESLTEENRERLEIVLTLSNQSQDSGERKLVMDRVEIAFSSANKLDDLALWLEPLGPCIRVMRGWTHLIESKASRRKIEQILELVDPGRDETHGSGWKAGLSRWVSKAASDEDRGVAAERIADAREKKDKCLDLKDLNLRTLPMGIGLLSHLEALMLRNNRLESFPSSMGWLTELTLLDIRDNNVTRLPDQIESMAGLTTLACDSTPLKKLPEWVGSLQSLKFLHANISNSRKLPRVLRFLPRPELGSASGDDLEKLRESGRLPEGVEIRQQTAYRILQKES